ncbi:hypothetical protein SNE35_22025 [Paucibacter sp. R3-3]|uniref:Uncharacterized protein n=1 Tax=Roseateles agri TaxID=3098619 RepID=A0ABU5DLL2_9BURK|nr:hypothetical protein [Paucibacter sp. R3-3]MDY0747199.1 hypothetical protein [Paucibacter sp. R3-3]
MMYDVPASPSMPSTPLAADQAHEQSGNESANDRLRDLVAASGLPTAVAMTVFNRGLGATGCTETQWKGFLADAGSARFVPLSDDWLSHAIEQFARIGVPGELA